MTAGPSLQFNSSAMEEKLMIEETRAYLALEKDSSAFGEDDADFCRTFCDNHPDKSKLEVRRLCGKLGVKHDDWDSPRFSDLELCFEGELNQLAKSADPCQIFFIRQKNSHSRLFITRVLFEELLRAYSVFPRIWDFMLPFSFKTQDSDIGHAPLRFHQLGSTSLSSMKIVSFECAYGFRYVKLNGRSSMSRGNPDYDPWSVRQTAVYQQYNSSLDKLILFLITPSDEAEVSLGEEVLRLRDSRIRLNPFHLHLKLVATTHDNWRLYIRSLERSLTKQATPVLLAQVQSETEQLSPLTNFKVKFIDQQRLKETEDKILDLVIIFESFYNTLSKLHLQCRKHCMGSNCVDCQCIVVLEGFEELMEDVQFNLKKVDVLYRRAQSTAKLLSGLLEYENAHIGHLNERSLNGLVKETNEENLKMMVLTERSTQDAAAVKILTVITLIYLPMSVVASIFSSQLIRVNDIGQVSVATGAYWFAIVTVPLTLATVVAWRLWLRHTMNDYERRTWTSAKPVIKTAEKGEHAEHGRLRSYLCLVEWPVRWVGRVVFLNIRKGGQGRITESGYAA